MAAPATVERKRRRSIMASAYRAGAGRVRRPIDGFAVLLPVA